MDVWTAYLICGAALSVIGFVLMYKARHEK